MRAEFLKPATWDFYKPIEIDIVKKNEHLLHKIFPETYKQLMCKFNGGTLSKLCMFKIKDYPYSLSIDSFCSLKGGGGFYSDADFSEYYSEMHYYYLNPPEGFPKGVIIFGGEGCGDFVGFDYRSNPNTDNPPIVYWKHDAEPGKDVFFVANSFDEFLDMLHPYSEE